MYVYSMSLELKSELMLSFGEIWWVFFLNVQFGVSILAWASYVIGVIRLGGAVMRLHNRGANLSR